MPTVYCSIRKGSSSVVHIASSFATSTLTSSWGSVRHFSKPYQFMLRDVKCIHHYNLEIVASLNSMQYISRNPTYSPVEMKMLTKKYELRYYRRNSDAGETLVECDSLQTACTAWVDGGGEGIGGLLRGFMLRHRAGERWLMKWCHSEGVQFPQAAMLSEPFKMVLVYGRLSWEEEKWGDSGVTEVKVGRVHMRII